MADVVTMILAGGQGSRLFPLTILRSKPAVPIAGKFRLVDVSISNCIHSNFRRIFILTQFAAESLHRHIFQTYRFSIFSKDFITILSAQQTLENRDWYQGTADAVRQNLRYIESYGDYVLVLSGDHLYRMDYSRFVEYHIDKGADITISVIPVARKRASQFGIMQVDKNGRITRFREKPKDPALLDELAAPAELLRQNDPQSRDNSHLASMGIYVFNKAVLFELLQGNSDEDFGREVIPAALQKKQVFAYFFNGYWEDIGTIKAFFDAHIDLTRPLPKFNFYDEDKPIFSHPRFLAGAKVLNAEVINSILCDGSIIDPSTIRNSIIGIRSLVGANSELEEVVMMGADNYESQRQKEWNHQHAVPNVGVGKNCVIRRAIIDKNARIGDNVRIVNERGVAEEEKENYTIRDGIVVVPKHAMLPEGTVV